MVQKRMSRKSGAKKATAFIPSDLKQKTEQENRDLRFDELNLEYARHIKLLNNIIKKAHTGHLNFHQRPSNEQT